MYKPNSSKQITITDIAEGQTLNLKIHEEGEDTPKTLTVKTKYYNEYYGTKQCQPYKEKIKICDSSNSKNYNCKIIMISSQKIECEILSELQNEAEGNVEIHIFQGLPKADKMELIIQKGTELGVVEFVPEFSALIHEINELLAGSKADAFNALPTWKDKYEFIERHGEIWLLEDKKE